MKSGVLVKAQLEEIEQSKMDKDTEISLAMMGFIIQHFKE